MRTAINGIIRGMLLSVLLGGWAPAMAQAPPGDDSPAAAIAGGEVQPCVPAADAAAATGEPGDAAQEAAPCEEPDGAPEPGDADSGPQAAVEEDLAVQASADEVFTPGDEISEDYPIPLPSDI